MEKSRKRSIRRHHRERLKKNRAGYWGWSYETKPMPSTFGNKVVDTPCDCSCWMCGNPRRHHNEITKGEYLSYLNFIEQCSEVDYYLKETPLGKFRNEF